MSDLTKSPKALLAALRALLGGLKTSMPAGLDKLAADGKVSLVTELETELQGYETVYQTEDDAAVALENAVKARDLIAPTAVGRYEAVRASLKAALGKHSPDLPKFGLEPDKVPAPLTIEQKTAQVAKAKATRKARGTLGKKQKAAIKGQVPAAAAPPPPVKI